MDFHAVAEAFIDGSWHVWSMRTCTALRQSSCVRISTGRDGGDIAFSPTTNETHAAL
jgi:hypothetical protein